MKQALSEVEVNIFSERGPCWKRQGDKVKTGAIPCREVFSSLLTPGKHNFYFSVDWETNTQFEKIVRSARRAYYTMSGNILQKTYAAQHPEIIEKKWQEHLAKQRKKAEKEGKKYSPKAKQSVEGKKLNQGHLLLNNIRSKE